MFEVHEYLMPAVRHAARLGLPVVFEDLGRRNGQIHSSGLIRINPKRSIIVQREVIYHEAGHWVLRHQGCNWHVDDRQERAANLYAAIELIDPVEYAAFERMYGPEPRTLAPLLGLTPKPVREWQRHHDSRGRTLRMDDAG